VPLQNRVTPDAEIIAHPARGSLMGNRGILHNPDRTLGKARWRHKAWISCVLKFKDRHSDVMPDNRYTRLFFLDEAVALAAGHRPCCECRHTDYQTFRTHWDATTAHSPCSAKDIDHALHEDRVDPQTRRQRTRTSRIDDVPNGAFVRLAGYEPAFLVWNEALYAYAFSLYAPPIKRPRSVQAKVLTPQSLCRVLQSGYTPQLHTSIRRGDPAT